MKQLRNAMDRLLSGLAGISFLVMVIVTCWQVVTRYVLKAPSAWSEELVSYVFAWMSLWGACLVTGQRGHMNIPLLVERAAPPWRRLLLCLGEGIAFLFSAVILCYGGLRITRLAMGQMTSSLGVTVGVFYVILPVSGLLNMGYTVLNVAEILNGQGEREKPKELRKPEELRELRKLRKQSEKEEDRWQ